jgi:magnesium transporter
VGVRHRRTDKKRSKKSGLPPGSLVLIGEQRAEPVRITALDYDEASCTEKRGASVDDCVALKGTPPVTWIQVEGLDVDVVRRLGEGFGLHPLTQEDLLNTEQRPKFEDYGGYLFVVLRMFRPAAEGGTSESDAVSEQVSLAIGPRWVISFTERESPVFDTVRERLKVGTGKVRKLGADYLAYSLIDSVVDRYFVTLEATGEAVEALEERVVQNPNPDVLREVYHLKHDLIFLRKSVWPLREVVSALTRSESPLIEEPTKLYLRDVYDHTIQVIDIIETYRDMASGMLDVYLSAVSNRMNEVMKVLTIIATIFIPLTFVAGLYGMNFNTAVSPWNMPELDQPFGYPMVLLLMGVIALGMLYFFKRKRWF